MLPIGEALQSPSMGLEAAHPICSFMGLLGPGLLGGQERTQPREQAQQVLVQLQEVWGGSQGPGKEGARWGQAAGTWGRHRFPFSSPPKSMAAKIFILGDALEDFLLPVKIHLVHSYPHLSFIQTFFFNSKPMWGGVH